MTSDSPQQNQLDFGADYAVHGAVGLGGLKTWAPQQEEQLQEQSVQPAESSTIPTLTRWWQTSKGGITGFVEGNRSITTAPLARGTRPQKGQVIETQDGKLYRLD
jgi:hypothetical protein